MSNPMIDQIKLELEALLPVIKQVTTKINAAEEEWIEHYGHDHPEEQYLRIMFYRISNDLQNGSQLIQQAFTEADHEGVLHKRADGLYGFGDMYFTAGSQLEYLDNDEDYGRRWIGSRIEYKDGDYRMWGTQLPLEGMLVRYKRVSQ